MTKKYASEDPSIVLDQIYDAITDRSPRSKKEDCYELCFYITYDVLHLKQVAGELWMASTDSPG